MFNQAVFNNDMSKRSVPGTAAQFSVGNGKRATLYVFTPTMIPTQVLRSYKYNFSPNLVDEMISAKDRLQASVAPNGLGLNSALVNSAIMPDAQGIPLNTSAMNCQYTFVLIVDTTPSPSARVALASPTTRIIATGFCTEEPCNVQTGTANPQAVLMFTKTNTTYVTPGIGQNGLTADINNASDLDVVNEVNGMLANGKDLYIGTPQDIRSMVAADPNGQMTGVYGSLCLNNAKSGEDSKLISGMLKTPKLQLGNIMSSLDSSVDYALAESDTISGPLAPMRMEDPLTIAKATFDQNVRGSMELQPRSGLDTSHPISMADLMYMFPDLDIYPIRIPTASAWDTTPQDVMTARNSMSSMLSASLSNLVPACGLANIMFTYQSFSQNGPMSLNSNKGVWQIDSYGMLAECPPRKQESAIHMFENYFEMELVPILKVVRGDFRVMAYVDVMGYILIDLVFMADTSMNLSEGFYETSSRLGGFTNPMIADLSTLNHNATQLDTLVTDTLGKRLGPENYFKPVIDTGSIDTPYTQPATTANPNVNMTPLQATVPASNRADYSSLF